MFNNFLGDRSAGSGRTVSGGMLELPFLTFQEESQPLLVPQPTISHIYGAGRRWSGAGVGRKSRAWARHSAWYPRRRGRGPGWGSEGQRIPIQAPF